MSGKGKGSGFGSLKGFRLLSSGEFSGEYVKARVLYGSGGFSLTDFAAGEPEAPQ